jgi:hypothetical protein
MVPRQNSETSIPVRPSVVRRMPASVSQPDEGITVVVRRAREKWQVEVENI